MNGRLNVCHLLHESYLMVWGVSGRLHIQPRSMSAILWEVANLLCSVPSFAGSIRFLAISRLPSAEPTMHSITPSCTECYLAEFSYRFNRRFDLAAMVPRLLRAAATTETLPLGILRISETGS
ncbi:hypothetical protein NSMM_490012 [Nitrosomonas mobilis]|uniref:Uncharacterized protein n=1 Tax=Nitrosomonas mobilis TaxID=51642 RepID=A0A1G5SG00_9PROT|nr:hypothetical protein NSMM_490012 [Nitrosomonas mobilis]